MEGYGCDSHSPEWLVAEREIVDAANFVVAVDSGCWHLAAVAAVRGDNSAVALGACLEIDLAVEMVDRQDSVDEFAVLVVDVDYSCDESAGE